MNWRKLLFFFSQKENDVSKKEHVDGNWNEENAGLHSDYLQTRIMHPHWGTLRGGNGNRRVCNGPHNRIVKAKDTSFTVN